VSTEYLNPPTLAPPVHGIYTQIVIGTGASIVAIAGQVAIDANGDLVGHGDHAAQAEQAFRNLKLALEAAGCTPRDLLKSTVHVVDHRPELVEPIFAAGRRVFGDNWPLTASMLLGVQSLGASEWLIEIDGIAVIG
jgi:enamine deaminase RidA (YjgF/YER057c/UK114 family)